MPTTALPPIAEVEVPTWKSPNELIHERINFDDTIWGFGLAGGAYYKTPLRITYVKPGSRAQMAHIYPGDVVLKINGIDSSTLTLEQAHEMILESGIHLKINVTSPEDLEDNYYCYQDPLEAARAEELKANELKLKGISKYPKVLAKSSHWGLQWPWKSKRKIIYKESNCYLVPSKYEEKHKDTRKPEVKQDDMIVLDSIHNVKGKKNTKGKPQTKNEVPDSEKNIADSSQETGGVKDKEEIAKHDTVDNNKEDSIEEHNNSSTNENEKDNITQQITSIDKDNEVGAIEQNGPVNEEDVTEQNNSVDENKETVVEEQNISENTNEGDTITEQNKSVDAVQDDSVEKNDENIVPELNNSESNNNQDIAAEENNPDAKNDEGSVLEQNSLDNKFEDDADQTESVNKKDEQDSTEAIDIPMSDSEKLEHNSR